MIVFSVRSVVADGYARIERYLTRLGAKVETLLMSGDLGAISFAIGLPLGLVFVGTGSGGVWENRWANRLVAAVVNGFRSLPLIILLVALNPLTRLIVGTSIAAAIVPLSISAIPYFSRVSEASLRKVDNGFVEALRAMGGGIWTIIREALLPEAMPSLIAGFTVNLVLLIGASAMAGAVGAGGLGNFAIRYGYQRFEISVMIAVIVVLMALVAIVQARGDRLARFVAHR